MAYVQGGLIEAIDFNAFRTQINAVYGVGNGDSGYGQTAITVPAVLGGFVEAVKSTEWTDLVNAIEACADHQGTDTTILPPTTLLEPNDIIYAHDGITNSFDIPGILTNITNNRLVADPTSLTQTQKNAQSLTATWNVAASTILDLTWPSADDARYFFNSGGEIIINATFVPGSVSSQNQSWENLLNSSGSIVINYNSTVNTGTRGTPSALGYYNLTSTTPEDLLFVANPASGGSYYFPSNEYRVRARMLNVDGTNADNGDTMRLFIDFLDNFSGGGDSVDGTLDVTIDERRATASVVAPTFNVTIGTALNAT